MDLQTSEKYIIRKQDDYYGINDTIAGYNVINGIHTEIEAKWLCDLLNELYDENSKLKYELTTLSGLCAFDAKAENIVSTDKYITIPKKDLIKIGDFNPKNLIDDKNEY